jgi:hypothetical protein
MAFIQGAAFRPDPHEGTCWADFRGARFTGPTFFSYTTFADTPWFHADEFFPGANFGDRTSLRTPRSRRCSSTRSARCLD